MPTITIYDYTHAGDDPTDDWADETRLIVPAKREVCSRCNGEGVHDHPAFSNGPSPEMFDDPDFREDYMGGVHDVSCSECDGKRVTDVPDWDAMTERQRELAEQHWQDESNHAAEVAAERRAGC